MKKMFKFMLVIIFSFVLIIGMFQTMSNADGYGTVMSGLIDDTYKDGTEGQVLTQKTNNITATIITSVRIIGVCVAIVMLLVVAMKYMTAAPGEKADIKKSAIQYVVGAIVLFGATGLLGLISNFATVF